MINPQLLDYIRREITKGKSREDISNDLIHGGGWLQADVDEAFREIEPASDLPQRPEAPAPEVPLPPQPPMSLPIEPIMTPPSVQPQPVMQAPQPIQVPQPAPQSPVQQATMELLQEKKRPYILWGFLLYILSLVIFGIFAFVFEGKFFLPILLLMGINIGVVIIVALILVLILALITSLMLHLATKFFKSIRSSWSKAVFAAGLIILMSAVSAIISVVAHPGTAFVILITLLMWAGQITILAEIYHIRPIKAFAVGIVQAILTVVVVGAIGLIVSVILSSHKTPPEHSGGTMQTQMIPTQQ